MTRIGIIFAILWFLHEKQRVNFMTDKNITLGYFAGTTGILLALAFLIIDVIKYKDIEIWKTLTIVILSELSIMLLMPVFIPENTSIFLEAIIDVSFLLLLVSPIAWRLRKNAQLLEINKQETEKSLYFQKAVNQLLSIPLHCYNLEDILNQALAVIFELQWLKIVPKGAIFLNDPDEKRLIMIADHQLSPEIKKSCAFVEHGKCLCGVAAKTLEIQHHSHLDDAHSVRFDGMTDHGHYIVPLISGGNLTGVLCLYLSAGHKFNEAEIDILKVLGTTLSEIIRAKNVLAELDLANTVFKHSLTCLMVTDRNNMILNVNPAFTDVTGYTLENVIGQSPKILSSGKHDAVFYSQMWHQIQKSGAWEGEIWNKKKNGELFLESLSVTVVYNEKNEISHHIAASADITHIYKTEERIRKLAYFDTLTGLNNRAMFYEYLGQAIIKTEYEGSRLGLLFIDLDHFKEVNDTLGHDAGDELLKNVAKRLLFSVRENDFVARLGGDEFVVILNNLNDTPHNVTKICKKIAEKILLGLSETHTYKNNSFQSGGSIGIVIYPDNAKTVSDLIQRADTAMYAAKKAGRNTYCFFSTELTIELEKKLKINQSLRKAILDDELWLTFQPLLDINQLKTIGAEVLLRWTNTELGEISPVVFIPLAEENGLIIEIGLWVFEKACVQFQAWKQNHTVDLEYLAINVSIHQLVNSNFVNQIKTICEQYDILPEWIELEITEGGLAQYPDTIADMLNQLKSTGFRLAIDDFGTDYSSLGRLKSFNVNLLKIDRSFVKNMVENSDDAAIVKAIIDLSNALNLTTLAEGIEIKEQLELLKQYGCSRGQGYFFGKPMRAVEFEKFVIP